MMNNAHLSILSIEDSDEDFYSLCYALKSAGIDNPVTRCADSRSAAAALSTEEGCDITEDAALILLDLNMPGIDGKELLETFRRRDRLKPVLILSTSSHPDDIEFCYAAGANSYLVKPLEFDKWQEMIASVCTYWLNTVTLPPDVHRTEVKKR